MIVAARDNGPSRAGGGREPIAITGIGAVSPLGHSFDAIADGLLAGRSGVRSVDPGEFARESHQFAAAVDAIPTPPDGVCVFDDDCDAPADGELVGDAVGDGDGGTHAVSVTEPAAPAVNCAIERPAYVVKPPYRASAVFTYDEPPPPPEGYEPMDPAPPPPPK